MVYIPTVLCWYARENYLIHEAKTYLCIFGNYVLSRLHNLLELFNFAKLFHKLFFGQVNIPAKVATCVVIYLFPIQRPGSLQVQTARRNITKTAVPSAAW